MKSANLNFLEASGPLRVCNGTALPLDTVVFLFNTVLYVFYFYVYVFLLYVYVSSSAIFFGYPD